MFSTRQKMYARKRLFLTDERLSARYGGAMKKKNVTIAISGSSVFTFFLSLFSRDPPTQFSRGTLLRSYDPHLKHPHRALGDTY